MGEVTQPTPHTRHPHHTTPPSIFTRYRPAVHDALRHAVPTTDDPFSAMMRYHLGWAEADGSPSPTTTAQGKALRPTLCLFCCDALGGDIEVARSAAAAIELVHNFSLVHDDIQDGDTERRHRPTAWALWGKPRALWMGNGMRALADAALWATASPAAPLHRLAHAAALLAQASLEMIEGQYLDLDFEARLDITTAHYLDMVARKTGALIRCAVEVGARLATDDDNVIAAFRRAGQSLGAAFQVRDDILGIWGSEAATGKATGNDIARRKKTYPIVYALEHAGPRDHDILARVFDCERVDQAGVAAVLAILERLGARQHSQALAERHARDAQAALHAAPVAPHARYAFDELVEFLLTRDF